jgi:hypothetical protein
MTPSRERAGEYGPGDATPGPSSSARDARADYGPGSGPPPASGPPVELAAAAEALFGDRLALAS